MTLTNFLVGKTGTLQGFKPKLGPNALGFRTGLREEYDRIAKILSGEREIRQKAKWQQILDRNVLSAGATKSSANSNSFKEM